MTTKNVITGVMLMISACWSGLMALGGIFSLILLASFGAFGEEGMVVVLVMFLLLTAVWAFTCVYGIICAIFSFKRTGKVVILIGIIWCLVVGLFSGIFPMVFCIIALVMFMGVKREMEEEAAKARNFEQAMRLWDAYVIFKDLRMTEDRRRVAFKIIKEAVNHNDLEAAAHFCEDNGMWQEAGRIRQGDLDWIRDRKPAEAQKSPIIDLNRFKNIRLPMMTKPVGQSHDFDEFGQIKKDHPTLHPKTSLSKCPKCGAFTSAKVCPRCKSKVPKVVWE